MFEGGYGNPPFGSTGDRSVPSGDPPDAVTRVYFATPNAGFVADAFPVPVGGPPTEAGESPAPPTSPTRSLVGSRHARGLDRSRVAPIFQLAMISSLSIGPNSTMQEVLEVFPGARRALFRRYHIGGCSSCGFSPQETLAQLCERNGSLDVEEVIAALQTSHEQDARLLISPAELAEWLEQPDRPRVLDIRSREEWEAARIDGALLLNQDLMQQILSRWPRHEPFVICDHQGRQGLDAAAYFLGHGFENVRCLRGGIDAWAQEVDARVPRYELA